jgi:hypothetical protein
MKSLLAIFGLAFLLFSCTNKDLKYREKKVTIVRVWSHRASNSLQDYEPLWKAKLSDSAVLTLRSKPTIGDTITYKFVY